MVVGTVIGSGIFFRNENIIAVVGGNLWIAIAAWLTGGFVTLSAAYVFSVLATRHEKVGGLVDYSEALLGERYGFMFGWFMAVIFYSAMGGLLAWVSGRFTVELFGWDVDIFHSPQTYMFAAVYLVSIFAINALSPKLAGKFQVSTAFIKLVPLIAMGIVGTLLGIRNGVTLENLNSTFVAVASDNPFLRATIYTVFAYMGWDTVLSLNSEVKNSKRNLPIALIGGMLVVMAIYVLYTVGIFSSASLEALSASGGVLSAFQGAFGAIGGPALLAFIIVSCLGALNGITITSQRYFYSMAVRGRGISPKTFSQVDPNTNAATNAAILYLLFAAGWMMVNGGNRAGWYGDIVFDIMGFVPITFQALLIPLYFWVIFKEKDLGVFNRFIAPSVAIAGSLFLVYAIVINHGTRVFWYVGAFIVLMGAGAIVMLRSERRQKNS